ncbi:MAG: MATE family efflux transporter [Dehalococcoidales bacterium]|nr:MAG: MATE family efflux transporter [Dehalococcoidales bacterium]
MEIQKEKPSELQDTTERLGYAPIGRLLLSLSLPAIASLVTMALYNIIDTFWVAKLGHEPIAALTVILPYSIIIMAVGVGTGVGVSSLVSRRFGEGEIEVTNRVAGQVFPLTIVFGGVFLVAAVFFADQILKICGATPDIMEYGRQYLTVIGFGGIFVFFGMVSSELLRGSGDAVRPMIFMVTAGVINMILDPFLIFGWWIFPEMGVSGAALATVIAQGVGAGLAFVYIIARKSSYRIKLSYLKPDLNIIKDIYRVGLPSMLTEVSESICFILLNNVLAGYGSMAIAAVGIIIRVIDFAFMPIIGIAEALLPIIGFNFGARLWKRMWGSLKLAGIWLVILLGLATIIMEILAPQLVGIFSQEEEMLNLAVPAMRLVIVALPFIGLAIIFIVTFQAMGKGREVLLLSLARQFIFFVPFIYILPNFMGVTGVWVALPISDVCGFLVTGSWLLREYRKLRRTGGWKDLPEIGTVETRD